MKQVPYAAPDFTLLDESGASHSLVDFADHLHAA